MLLESMANIDFYVIQIVKQMAKLAVVIQIAKPSCCHRDCQTNGKTSCCHTDYQK